MTSTRIAALIAGAALALPLAATAQDLTINEIDVTVDLTAVQNPAAADYWGQLEGDLEGAILGRLTGQIDDNDGADLEIDISEVELANGFTEAMGLADAMLKGVVKQTHDTKNNRFNTYELTVDVRTALPADFDWSASNIDTAAVYSAMVETFADHVVRNIK